MVEAVRRRWAGFGAAALLACASGCVGGNEQADTGIPPFDASDVTVRRDGAPGLDASDASTDMDATVEGDAFDAGGGTDAAEDAGDAAVVETGGEDAVDVVTDPNIHVRLANIMSPSGTTPPPAVDVCIRPTGAPGFIGPAFEAAGLRNGLGWNQVSTYIDVPEGTYDVEIVSADAVDCNTPLFPVISGLNPGPGGTYATAVMHGTATTPADGGPDPTSFRVALLIDHNPAGAAAEPKPRLRLFHAQPLAPALDVGIVPDPSTFVPIFHNVSFGELGLPVAGVEPAFDAEHYFASDVADSVAPVGARAACPDSDPACGNPTLLTIFVYIPAQAYITSYLTTVMAGSYVGLGTLVCLDSNPSVAGLTDCRVCSPGNADPSTACR